MIEKLILEKLYLQEKLSMVEIAQKLNVGNHAVVWWMTQHGILRRSRSEASYARHNPNGDPFRIKSSLTTDEERLMGIGLGLYWGEGNKANDLAVRLGNSDPNLLRTFHQFLREICGVEEEKIRFWLQVFSDIDESEALAYWLRELGVERDRFTPHVIVSPPQGKGTYRNKSKYGVVTLFVCNKKLRDWFSEQLKVYGYMPT